MQHDHQTAANRTGQPRFRVILFTDIVDSTALYESLGDEVSARLVLAHNRVVRRLLARHGGEEIKFTGDGFHLAFERVEAALAFAVALQLAMQRFRRVAQPLAVRIGISAGKPIAADNDLFGSVVNLAARLCQQAERGRILVSERLRELAGSSGRFGAQCQTRLKGFDRPVTCYPLVWG
ncbi:adenylate/guanylate cyclase domain-containing protein [Motiliproteus sp. SC1-56]|uniref:adenylate/guanylate cyclase domain-containing protein n=1 Tax=Motiliproteus sp. SC1-56 TaxID=2799565 RepID=UPI001A8DC83C|nr:adenylate/guanylate cyclase domain-containing protein [Motiliproteus sp. SC1-56]